MVLHLAPKKSYHPARKENIERVKRDEAEAKRQQELEDSQLLHADAQARLELLRGTITEKPPRLEPERPKKRKRLDPGEAALEAQLNSKGWDMSRAAQAEMEEQEITSRAVIVRPETETTVDTNGHINFWADLEKGVVPAQQGNAEYLAEKKKEQDKWDEQITMYLGRPAKELRPWYGERDMINGQDKKKSDDQRLEAAYKDEELKRMADPLTIMSSYLKQRDEVKHAMERAKQDPWAATPQRVATPVPSLLRKRSKPGEEPAYKRHILHNLDKEDLDYGPTRPAPPKAPPAPEEAKPSLAESAKAREASERARAQALKDAAKRKRKMSETPRTEYSGYMDQFNKRETRDAHRSRAWQARRWDDDADRDRDRRSVDGSRR